MIALGAPQDVLDGADGALEEAIALLRQFVQQLQNDPVRALPAAIFLLAIVALISWGRRK